MARRNKECPDCNKMILEYSNKCSSCAKKGKTAWNKGIPNTWYNPIGLEVGWKAKRKLKELRIKKNCCFCGKEFEVRPSLDRVRYCSISCGKLKDFSGNESIWEEKRKLMQRKEYKLWRQVILEKDNYSCTICGFKENLHVDHIKSWKEYPELRYAIDNGRVLCASCHQNTPNYGFRIFWQDRRVLA